MQKKLKTRYVPNDYSRTLYSTVQKNTVHSHPQSKLPKYETTKAYHQSWSLSQNIRDRDETLTLRD